MSGFEVRCRSAQRVAGGAAAASKAEGITRVCLIVRCHMAEGIGARAVGGDSPVAYPLLQQAGDISLARVEPCPFDILCRRTGWGQVCHLSAVTRVSVLVPPLKYTLLTRAVSSTRTCRSS